MSYELKDGKLREVKIIPPSRIRARRTRVYKKLLYAEDKVKFWSGSRERLTKELSEIDHLMADAKIPIQKIKGTRKS